MKRRTCWPKKPPLSAEQIRAAVGITPAIQKAVAKELREARLIAAECESDKAIDFVVRYFRHGSKVKLDISKFPKLSACPRCAARAAAFQRALFGRLAEGMIGGGKPEASTQSCPHH